MKSITKQMINSVDTEKFISFYACHTYDEIMKEFSVTKKVIHELIKKLNIEPKGSGGNSTEMFNRRVKQFIEDHSDIEDYYKTHSTVVTAKYFNCTTKLLLAALSSLNITPHTKGENTMLTCDELYGGIGWKSDTLRQKSRDKSLETYGSINNSKQNKLTCLTRYGATTYIHSDIGKEAVKTTLNNKYNVDNPFQMESTKVARKISYWKSEVNDYSDIYNSIRLSKVDSENYLVNNYKTRRELADDFNCSLSSIATWLRTYDLFNLVKPTPYSSNSVSNFEKEILESVRSMCKFDIVQNDRTVLDGKEIDIYIPDLHLGIECNGIYYHNDEHVGKFYHELKSKLAESKGIRLIHIYENEWILENDKIMSLLKIALQSVDSKIYARDCEIREITNKEARQFNENNHLQGHRNAKITYGLFFNNKLVQLMSFSHNRKYEWEIIRGCPASNNIVVGGVSKLFKHFVKQHNPKEVFSYCDFNKFDGRGYNSLGMEFIGYTGPNLLYVLSDGSCVTRNPHKHDLYESMAKYKIWGAGSKKYLVKF